MVDYNINVRGINEELYNEYKKIVKKNNIEVTGAKSLRER